MLWLENLITARNKQVITKYSTSKVILLPGRTWDILFWSNVEDIRILDGKSCTQNLIGYFCRVMKNRILVGNIFLADSRA